MKYNLICCHDAGGANIIYKYFDNKSKKNFKYLIHGPATKIFKNKNSISFLDLKKIKIGKIYTGTSNTSILEKEVIKYGIENEIKVITFLDHYVNFKKRFYLNGKFIYPNEIWTHDIYSKNIAKKVFKKQKNIKILLKKNYYLKHFKNIKKNNNIFNIVYISEKIHINKQNFSKLSLNKLFKILTKVNLKKNKKLRIILNLHPSEKIQTYHLKFKQLKNLKFSVSNNLRSSLLNANIVVGIRSYALVISKSLKIKTYTILPIKNLKSFLPFNLKSFSTKTINNDLK